MNGNGRGPGRSSKERVAAVRRAGGASPVTSTDNAPFRSATGQGGRASEPPMRRPEFERESPAVVSADKRVAVKFALAKQRALMWAAARERSPRAAVSSDDDVHPVCRQRERTCALKFADLGDMHECFRFHDQPQSPEALEAVALTAAAPPLRSAPFVRVSGSRRRTIKGTRRPIAQSPPAAQAAG